MATDDVIVIGAGPYGLSISAHLNHVGVEHRIVGRPMNTWFEHMPAGMYLKSEPYASDMATPLSGYNVEAFCEQRGLDYQARLGPLSLERFSQYAQWYARALVPNIEDDLVTPSEPQATPSKSSSPTGNLVRRGRSSSQPAFSPTR